jgi:hypothetical protein
VAGDEQAMHMEGGQHVQQHVAGPESPVLVQRARVVREVAVGQHRPLGAPGGARGVEDGGEVARAAFQRGEFVRLRCRSGDQRALPGIVEFQHVRHARLRREFVGERAHLRPADEQPRRRILEEMLQLMALVGRVERQEDGASAQAGEIQHQRLGRLFHLRGKAIAGLQAQRDDHVGHACRSALDVAVGPHATVGQDHAGRRGIGGKTGSEKRIEVAGHDGAALKTRNAHCSQGGAASRSSRPDSAFRHRLHGDTLSHCGATFGQRRGVKIASERLLQGKT